MASCRPFFSQWHPSTFYEVVTTFTYETLSDSQKWFTIKLNSLKCENHFTFRGCDIFLFIYSIKFLDIHDHKWPAVWSEITQIALLTQSTSPMKSCWLLKTLIKSRLTLILFFYIYLFNPHNSPLQFIFTHYLTRPHFYSLYVDVQGTSENNWHLCA